LCDYYAKLALLGPSGWAKNKVFCGVYYFHYPIVTRMKKYILGAVFSFALLASPAFTQAASLTSSQVNAIVGLLQSFGADQSVIANVQAALGGPVTIQSSSTTSGVPYSTLSVTRGFGDPVSNNILAGASSVRVGEFNFAAHNSSYTVQNLAILVPTAAAGSITNVSVSYKDVNGVTQTATQALNSTGAGNITATFTGLTMYVPSNNSANLDVSVGTATIASGAISGATINISLDTGNASTSIDNTFRALNSTGALLTVVNSGTPIASNGTFYVRKSIPTFAMVNTGNTVPSTGTPLYKFTISADPAGAIEWSKVSFNVTATNSVTLSNLYLINDASGINLLDNSVLHPTMVGQGMASGVADSAYVIPIDLSKNTTRANYGQIAAGSTKTYDLYGTVAGFTSGSTLSIGLTPDTSSVTNASAAVVSANAIAGNIVWSDRSAVAHSVTSSDWTNGYLLKDFTSGYGYSKAGTTAAPIGTGLKVSLSPTSPNGTVLSQGQSAVDLADFVFTNPTSAPINVTALSFKRIGASNDATLANVYLYNAGTRLTNATSVNNSAFIFSNPLVLFTVPVNGTYTVSVRSDIAATGTSSQKVGIQLVSVTGNSGLDASVSLPISTGYQTISATTIPTVTLSVSPSTIQAGQSTTLTWSSMNATSCAISATNAATDNGRWGKQFLASTGSYSLTPYTSSASSYTATYQITCTGPGGTSNPSTATVTVVAVSTSTPATSPSVIGTFSYQEQHETDSTKMLSTYTYRIQNYRSGLVLDVEPIVNCNDTYIAPLKRDCSQYLFNLSGKAAESYSNVQGDPYVKGGALYRFTGASGGISALGFINPAYTVPAGYLNPVPDNIDFVFTLRDINQGGATLWTQTQRAQFKG
jgi:hypothetical protein